MIANYYFINYNNYYINISEQKGNKENKHIIYLNIFFLAFILRLHCFDLYSNA